MQIITTIQVGILSRYAMNSKHRVLVRLQFYLRLTTEPWRRESSFYFLLNSFNIILVKTNCIVSLELSVRLE